MHWTQIIVGAAFTIYITFYIGLQIVLRRTTGVSGRGHARGHAAAAILSATAMMLLLTAAVAFILNEASLDWFGRITLPGLPLAQALGAAALFAAGVCFIWGAISLGPSFRVALPETRQTLVTHGIYRVMRNPLALSVDLLATGVFLLATSWLSLASLIANLVSYEWKIRIEEVYLCGAHGKAYATYCIQVGRYLPRPFHNRPDTIEKPRQ